MNFEMLRKVTASYIRQHGEDFAPFIGVSTLDEAFQSYCNKVESVASAEWGGQLEIKAMCNLLDREIWIYSADSSVLKMASDTKGSSDRLPLKITYHRHFYSLGEHYNSVEYIDR